MFAVEGHVNTLENNPAEYQLEESWKNNGHYFSFVFGHIDYEVNETKSHQRDD
jgi:hypothetical protein